MKLQHKNTALEREGKRVHSLLKEGLPLQPSDLRVVSEIVDESESLARGIGALYGSVFIVMLVVALLLKFGFSMEGDEYEGYFSLIFLSIFAAFGIHFFYAIRIDNYRPQIERFLKCNECGQQIFGFLVHKLAKSHQCSACEAGLDKIFTETRDTNTQYGVKRTNEELLRYDKLLILKANAIATIGCIVSIGMWLVEANQFDSIRAIATTSGLFFGLLGAVFALVKFVFHYRFVFGALLLWGAAAVCWSSYYALVLQWPP